MNETTHVRLLGVSFRTAPVAVREALSFTPAAAGELLRLGRAEIPGIEALVLATCNRTEFHLVLPASHAVEDWLALVRRVRPDAPILRDDCPRYQAADAEAVRHLVRVASGLESLILGDGQILGQVKEAVAVAREAGTWGPEMERITRHALRAGKRARRDTAVARGNASIGSAIATMAAARGAQRIVVVGAGTVARDVGRHLAKRDGVTLAFVNRTEAAAHALAADCGGSGHPLAALAGLLVDADLAVTATAAPRPVLSHALLDRVLALRMGRALTVVDAGMPRNVEPGPGVSVIDIDAIREERASVLAARRAAVPAVEAIVDDEVASYTRWRAGRATDDAIRALLGQVDAAGRAAAGELAGAAGIVAADVERIFVRSFKRLMHGHMRTLRALAPAAQGGR